MRLLSACVAYLPFWLVLGESRTICPLGLARQSIHASAVAKRLGLTSVSCPLAHDRVFGRMLSLIDCGLWTCHVKAQQSPRKGCAQTQPGTPHEEQSSGGCISSALGALQLRPHIIVLSWEVWGSVSGQKCQACILVTCHGLQQKNARMCLIQTASIDRPCAVCTREYSVRYPRGI